MSNQILNLSRQDFGSEDRVILINLSRAISYPVSPHKTWILEIKGDKEFQDKLCTNLQSSAKLLNQNRKSIFQQKKVISQINVVHKILGF